MSGVGFGIELYVDEVGVDKVAINCWSGFYGHCAGGAPGGYSQP
jgi:hypothetical protein